MTTCRSCGATVVWVRTSNGKMMPLDATPSIDGNLTITDGVVRPADMLTPPGERCKSHFATCPHAAQHRKATR